MLGFALAEPTQITDLTAGWSAIDSVTLDWTAPGNQALLKRESGFRVSFGCAFPFGRDVRSR